MMVIFGILAIFSLCALVEAVLVVFSQPARYWRKH
jgi:hypothetical protein